MSIKKSVQIKVAPAQSRNLGIRIRNNPKKSVVAAIKRFDQLVEQGLISDLKFSSEGVITGGNISNKISQADYKAIRRVITLSQEHHFRATSALASEKDIELFHKRQHAKIEGWESKGGFEWLHPALEEDILRGVNPLFVLTLAERTYGKKSAGLRALVSKYNARPETVIANLKKQLIFFKGQLLKQKVKKEIVIMSEIGPEDKATTVVRLSGQNVVRETTALLPSVNTKVNFVVTLLLSGKVTHLTTRSKMFK